MGMAMLPPARHGDPTRCQFDFISAITPHSSPTPSKRCPGAGGSLHSPAKSTGQTKEREMSQRELSISAQWRGSMPRRCGIAFWLRQRRCVPSEKQLVHALETAIRLLIVRVAVQYIDARPSRAVGKGDRRAPACAKSRPFDALRRNPGAIERHTTTFQGIY